MTDEIDLEELDVESDDDETGNRGDWLWREEGDPGDEPDGWLSGSASGDDGGEESGDATGEPSDETADDDPDHQPAPHVPRENEDSPVGIPIEQGGAGGGPARDADDPGGGRPSGHGEDEDADGESVPATGDAPHGTDADEMTMALTYEAAQRFADPGAVFADASAWADWVGIVGDVEAHAINAFQREHHVDVDFFNGSGRGAAERLAGVDEHSMFYAERMVVVGVDGEEALAERAGWEFVPLAEAAEKADWDLRDADAA